MDLTYFNQFELLKNTNMSQLNQILASVKMANNSAELDQCSKLAIPCYELRITLCLTIISFLNDTDPEGRKSLIQSNLAEIEVCRNFIKSHSDLISE